MKKIMCGAVLAVGIYGGCEGMMADTYRSQDWLGRLDLLLQEEKNLQESKLRLVEGIKKQLLVKKNEFNKEQVLSDVNEEIKEYFTELLDESLEGNVDSLEFLSERIFNGRLMNKLIFNSSGKYELCQRKSLIYQVSLVCCENSCGVTRILRNMKKYCPEEKEVFFFNTIIDKTNEML